MARIIGILFLIMALIGGYELFRLRPKVHVMPDGLRVVDKPLVNSRSFYAKTEDGRWEFLYSVALSDTSRSSLP